MSRLWRAFALSVTLLARGVAYGKRQKRRGVSVSAMTATCCIQACGEQTRTNKRRNFAMAVASATRTRARLNNGSVTSLVAA